MLRRPNFFIKRPQGAVPHTFLQTQTTECGLGAMAMILAHHGRFVTMEELRQVSGVSRDCVNAADLARIARHYGLAVKVLRKEPEQLAGLGFPLIGYLNFIHFVVVEDVTEDEVWLNDPACARHRVPREAFHESFTGIVLAFSSGPDFQPGGEPPDTFANVRRFLVGNGMAWLVAALLAGALLTAPLVLFALVFGGMADQLPGSSRDFLMPALLGMGLAVALRAGLQFLQSWTLSRLEIELCRKRLPALVKHLLGLPYAFFVYRIPVVLHRRIYDNELVANLLCADILPALFSLPGLLLPLVALFYYDTAAGYSIAGLIAAYLLLLALLFQGKAGAFRSRREQDDVVWMNLAHSLGNYESFKTGGSDREFFNGSMSGCAGKVKLRQEFGWFQGLSALAPDLFAALMVLTILVCASFGMADGGLSFGGFFAMLILASSLHAPMRGLAGLHGKLDALRLVLPPIDDLVDQVPNCREQSDTKQEVNFSSGHILSATDISFGFTRVKPPLLQGVSLAIAPGEQLGITGPSGGGKSTLAEVLIGLHRPWSGEVLLDGQPLSSLSREQLSGEIAWVNKRPFFFPGTVRENLCLWQDGFSDDDIQVAIRDACLDETIAHCPDGLETMMMPRASNFSGGQRQRLEIARALLRKPRILVLDEATDGLDHALEQSLRANLKRRGMTLIIVSHRASTLAACDRVLRLVNGRLANGEFIAAADVPPISLDFAAEEDPKPPCRPPGDRRMALLQVFRQVAAAVGEHSPDLPLELLAVEGSEVDEKGIVALARHNRIPVRAVRFVVSKWWRLDHGPLIAFTHDGHRPVAVLPKIGSGYRIHDPESVKAQPVTAQDLEPRAFMLHARFLETRKQPFRFFLHDFSQIWTDLRTVLIASLALAALSFGTPLAGYTLFAEVLPFADTGFGRQWENGLVLLGAGIILVEVIRLLALHRLEGRLEISACSALYQQVMRVRPLFFREHDPEQVARSLNCVPRVLDVLRNGSLRRLFGGFGGLAGLAVIAWFSGWLALVALLLVLPLAIVPPMLTRLRLPWQHLHFNQRLDSYQFLFELFKGAPRLRQAGRENAAMAYWQQGYIKEKGMALRIQLSETLSCCFADAYPWLATAGFIGAIIVQGGLIDGSAPAMGRLAAVFLAFQSTVFATQGFALALSDMARASPHMDQLTPLAAASVEPVGLPQELSKQNGAVELRGLGFTYPGCKTPTLKDVSLRIEPGQFVALAGPSGSGKSTLLRLLLGFYPADTGVIIRNGESGKEENLSAWREQVGAVLQDDQLEIAMSVRGHILGGAVYNMAEIREAARLAMLEPDINAMPMVIQSIVDSDKVSTGQKQRLLIARRLLRRPKLLILDEATNALPEDIQSELLANLRKLGIACLLVSHRASTITAADRVYLMDAGRIVWSGTPNEFVEAGHVPAMHEEEDESDW
jgi:ABC-type bacteriocin/lantibiotic exporter with double-glycine peptidase domain